MISIPPERKTLTIGIAIVAIAAVALGTWYLSAYRAGSVQSTQQPEIPTPVLASITAKQEDTLVVTALGATNTRDVRIDISTQIYKDGKPIKATALKKGQTVAIVFYPASIGVDNIAQSITVVSTN